MIAQPIGHLTQHLHVRRIHLRAQQRYSRNLLYLIQQVLEGTPRQTMLQMIDLFMGIVQFIEQLLDLVIHLIRGDA